MSEKSGKVKGARILATGLTIVILVTLALVLRALFGLNGMDSIDSAWAQEDSERGFNVESDTLAEWHVFLVATNNYYDPNDPRLSRLRYAEADADSFEKIFKALGVKDENITVLKSSNPDYFASTSKESIEKGYQRFLNGLTEESIAFVFLSGHGFVGRGTTRSYYLPKDCTLENREEKKIS